MKHLSGNFLASGKLVWDLSDMKIGGDGITIVFRIYGTRRERDALNTLKEWLTWNKISWIHPKRGVTKGWIIDLKELRSSFDFLKDLDWADGLITVLPNYDIEERENSHPELRKSSNSIIEFVVTPHGMEYYMNTDDCPELSPFIEQFLADYPNPSRCGFIMMNFTNSKLHQEIVGVIKEYCAMHGIIALRADDKAYSEDLLFNIRTYMHACRFGIAVFERLSSDNFNPNVSLEVGYMMALGKPILLMKDSTLNSLPTDLVGRLYSSFETQSSGETIPPILAKWLYEKAIIE